MSAILLTGGSGQVGRHLLAADWPAGTRLLAPQRDALDLCDPGAIAGFIAQHSIALVVHAAACTAVDRCETEIAEAWRANALASAALAQCSRRAGIPILALSSDYVFDGAKRSPYLEDDCINPLSVYGASKAGGELAVRRGNPRHLIVRTSWVVSAVGGNFLTTILRLARERKRLRVVADQTGAPTSARDLAAAIVMASARALADPQAAGTFHFCNAGETTWHGLAEAILAESRRRGGPYAIAEPIATAQYPLPAARPAYSVLSTAAFSRTFAFQPRPWQTAVADIMAEVMPERAGRDEGERQA